MKPFFIKNINKAENSLWEIFLTCRTGYPALKKNYFRIKKVYFLIAILVLSKTIPAQDISWNTLPDFPLSSLAAASATSNDSSLFFIANYNIATVNTSFVYYYSFTSSKWKILDTVPERVYNCSLKTIDSCLYIIGGDWFSNKTYCYNLITGKWNLKENMPTPRQHIAYSSAVIDSFIYVIGGLEKGNYDQGSDIEKTIPSNKNQRYNCKKNKWEELAPMPTPRQNVSVVAVDSLIYVIGGEGDSKSIWTSLKNVEVYNTINNTWSIAPALPFTRSMTGAELIANEIWVLCGWRDGYYNIIDDRIFIYNIKSGTWRISTAKTPKLIAYAGITSRNGKIYVINGCNNSFTGYNSVYELEKRSVSINNFYTEKTICIFPNPTSGLATLSFSKTPQKHATIEIYKIDGKLALAKSYQNQTTATIDLTGFQSGIYVVKVIADGLCFEEKIIKE